MKSFQAERVVWYLHPFREMKVRTSNHLFYFLLHGFQLEFHQDFVKLYLAFDMGEVQNFSELFPIFQDNLQDLRKQGLVEVVNSPSEVDGLVLKVTGNINGNKLNPISLITDILSNRWMIPNVKIFEDYHVNSSQPIIIGKNELKPPLALRLHIN